MTPNTPSAANRFRSRAWDIKNKRFCSGNIAIDCYGFLYWMFGDSIHMVERDEYILVWSTGLLDSKGKEIFDGDILDFGKKNGIQTVRWSQEDGAWISDRSEYYSEWHGKLISQAWLGQVHKNCKVIGNIYENPDLLLSSTHD